MHIVDDLYSSGRDWKTWVFLGWDDIGRRYQRSKLGPLWLTGGLAAMTVGIGILYSQILSVPLDEYLTFLAAGLSVWLFVSVQLSESCFAFQSSSGIVKNYDLAKTTLILRVLWRNLIAFGHHLVFVVLLATIRSDMFTPAVFWIVPGLLLLLVILLECSLILAVLSARYRDIGQMVTYFLQAVFFVTPIMWQQAQVVNARKFVDFNPFYYMVALVRDPLTGTALTSQVLLGALILIVALGAVAIPVYSWGRSKVIFWI